MTIPTIACTRTQKPLQRAENREFYYVSTTDDPAIEKLAEEQAGTWSTARMPFFHCPWLPRSMCILGTPSQKLDGVLVFDKRDTANFDYLDGVRDQSRPAQVPRGDRRGQAI